MPHTDAISDMLTRIRNAVKGTHETVEIPASKLKINVAEILKKEGYINSYQVSGDTPIDKKIVINLKYGARGEKAISGIEKVSTPGLRVYVKSKEAPRVYEGLGISVISTSKGLMTDRQARKQKMGGEVLCKVW